jgi:hypothetical protein
VPAEEDLRAATARALAVGKERAATGVIRSGQRLQYD